MTRSQEESILNIGAQKSSLFIHWNCKLLQAANERSMESNVFTYFFFQKFFDELKVYKISFNVYLSPSESSHSDDEIMPFLSRKCIKVKSSETVAKANSNTPKSLLDQMQAWVEKKRDTHQMLEGMQPPLIIVLRTIFFERPRKSVRCFSFPDVENTGNEWEQLWNVDPRKGSKRKERKGKEGL